MPPDVVITFSLEGLHPPYIVEDIVEGPRIFEDPLVGNEEVPLLQNQEEFNFAVEAAMYSTLGTYEAKARAMAQIHAHLLRHPDTKYTGDCASCEPGLGGNDQ